MSSGLLTKGGRNGNFQADGTLIFVPWMRWPWNVLFRSRCVGESSSILIFLVQEHGETFPKISHLCFIGPDAKDVEHQLFCLFAAARFLLCDDLET